MQHGVSNPCSRRPAGVPGRSRVIYRKLGLRFIAPELREGGDEVGRAAAGTLPRLVALDDVRGELHCHSTSSDGAHTIRQMLGFFRHEVPI